MDYVAYAIAAVMAILVLYRVLRFVTDARNAIDLSDAVLGRRRPLLEPGRTVWEWLAEPTMHRRVQRDLFAVGMRVFHLSENQIALALAACVKKSMSGRPFGVVLNEYVSSHFRWKEITDPQRRLRAIASIEKLQEAMVRLDDAGAKPDEIAADLRAFRMGEIT